MRRTSGSIIRAMASESICCSPPERSLGPLAHAIGQDREESELALAGGANPLGVLSDEPGRQPEVLGHA